MKTKNRTFKALCVVLLVGFGLFQNVYFETKHLEDYSNELNQIIRIETEKDWKEPVDFIIKTVTTGIKHLN